MNFNHFDKYNNDISILSFFSVQICISFKKKNFK